MLVRRISRTKRRGAYLVEFAVVSTIFFMFVFGIFEYARFLMTMEVMQNAAREGARYAVVHTYDKTTADVQNEVDLRLGGVGAQLQGYNRASNIRVYVADSVTGQPIDSNGTIVGDWKLAPFTNAQFGQPIAVQISGVYKPILPTFLLMNSSMNIQARYMMQSEAN